MSAVTSFYFRVNLCDCSISFGSSALSNSSLLMIGADEIGSGKEPSPIPYQPTADHPITQTGEVFQLLMGCRESDWPAILKGTSGAKIAAWWDRAVDIIPISGGKGAGIRKVLAYYGLTPEDAMAFGDGNNDIEMFQAVGHSVAMGNASADLKAIASEEIGRASCRERV